MKALLPKHHQTYELPDCHDIARITGIPKNEIWEVEKARDELLSLRHDIDQLKALGRDPEAWMIGRLNSIAWELSDYSVALELAIFRKDVAP